MSAMSHGRTILKTSHEWGNHRSHDKVDPKYKQERCPMGAWERV